MYPLRALIFSLRDCCRVLRVRPRDDFLRAIFLLCRVLRTRNSTRSPMTGLLFIRTTLQAADFDDACTTRNSAMVVVPRMTLRVSPMAMPWFFPASM